MIQFVAALKGGKTSIQIDPQDGNAEIRLITSGTELSKIMGLMCMKGKAFKVMIFELGEKPGKTAEVEGE